MKSKFLNNIKETVSDYWEHLSSPDTVTGLFFTWTFAGLLSTFVVI